MLVFPQLTTGTVAVYPVERRRRRRTVANALSDLSAVVYSDSDFAETQWDLQAVGLSDGERGALVELFEATAGGEKTFTFLEPAGNLLAQSESFGDAVWSKSALMSVSAGVGDPWGGTRASRVTNGGPVDGQVSQELAVPASFQYAVSVWVRADVATAVTLFAESATGSTERTFEAGSAWTKLGMAVAMGAAGESVRFGFRLAAAKTVDVVGMQVDAQPAPGDYQRTGARGGVYPQARFGMDELTVRARGADVFDAVVRVVSKEN